MTSTRKISTDAGTVELQSDGPLNATIKFDKKEVNAKIEAIANEANKLARTHIKEQLAKSAHQTSRAITNKTVKEIHGRSSNPFRAKKSKAPIMIGNSLGYHFKHATKDRIVFGAGSYDRDEGLNVSTRFSSLRGDPTGIRASDMQKTDPSLTEIYEETQGTFEVTGVISDPKDKTFVRPGETSSTWKRKDIEKRRAAFYAMKGYGAKSPRKGKAPPKVKRRGWKGLYSVSLYQRNFAANLNATAQILKGKIERIRIPESGKRQTTLGEF